jgi:alpha-mannosidase
VDTISIKKLPPAHSFCSFGGSENSLVLSALKKADLSGGLILRFYEVEGAPAETSVRFVGRYTSFSEVNFLEEEVGAKKRVKILKVPAFSIKTLMLDAAVTAER